MGPVDATRRPSELGALVQREVDAALRPPAERAGSAPCASPPDETEAELRYRSARAARRRATARVDPAPAREGSPTGCASRASSTTLLRCASTIEPACGSCERGQRVDDAALSAKTGCARRGAVRRAEALECSARSVFARWAGLVLPRRVLRLALRRIGSTCWRSARRDDLGRRASGRSAARTARAGAALHGDATRSSGRSRCGPIGRRGGAGARHRSARRHRLGRDRARSRSARASRRRAHGLEANLRFAGPETLETKVFARLSAWQNWIFQRPNASGPDGALAAYGRPVRAKFDWKRT
jgi:hypothetical protein